MKVQITAAMVLSVALCFGMSSAAAAPRYKLNSAKTQVIALSGLASGEMCQPARISGRVVAINYDALGAAIESFSLEGKDGARHLINVDLVAIGDADMVTIAWVKQGLQQIIRQGNRLSIGVLYCGAAGRVIMLDSLRAR